MPIRRMALALVFLAVPASAYADRHFADLMAGGFLAKGSNFRGWQVSGSWPIMPCREISLVGSFGRYKGTEDDDSADHTLATYIIGGRYSFHGKWFGHEYLPFFQVLGGGVDNIREIAGDLRQVKTHAVIVVGAGMQPAFKRDNPQAVPRLRLRLQVDGIYRQEQELGPVKAGGLGVAVSLGLVYQFGPEFPCHEKKSGCDPTAPPPPPKPSARPAPITLP